MSFKNRQNNNFSVISQRDGSRSFRGDHDDRFYGSSNYRGRGSRGSRGRNRRGGFKNFNAYSSRYRNNRQLGDDDGDESMGDHNRNRGSSRFSYQRSRGMRRSGSGRMGGQGRSNFNPEQQWYKIIVPFGARLGQTELFKLIQDNIDVQIQFHNHHTMEQRALFFVQGASIADSLRLLSRRISMPTGQKITLLVSESGPPKMVKNISDDHKEKLKVCMSGRYEPSSQYLNLSSLCTDENLKRESIFLPLNRPNVMEAVTKIITENIPEMTGVDLSKNKLGNLGGLSGLIKAAIGVVSLNIGDNQIRSLEELEKFKGWTNIVELNLDGNGLCDSYTNQADYISAVRKIFPKVIKLDGKDLPPPISFDLETIPLPATQGSYFLNDEVKNLLVTFVKEYYTIFDSDSRRGLMSAYNENSQFSYCCARNAILDRQGDFAKYIKESRNLKKAANDNSDVLVKKIKVGLMAVMSSLEEFPKTTHDLNSFIVDVMLATPQMLTFVLHGVFKETASRADKPVIRSFSRTFVTIPAGAGISIVNDMMILSNAGVEQSRNAFKEGAPTPSSSPASSSQISPTSQPVPPVDQQKMIELFVAQSGMISEFSMKCLQENSWDYQRAAHNFQELHSQGKIPPEAFIKK